MKFSIRDLLLVTVIVALAVGWCVDHNRLAYDAARFQEEMGLAKDNLKRTDGNLKAILEVLRLKHGMEPGPTAEP